MRTLKNIIELFKNNNYELYAIGGYVRNQIYQNSFSDDIDLLTNASMDEIINMLGYDYYHVQINNIVKVKTPEEKYIEIASYDYLDTDLCSRDFKINAIAFNMITSEYYIPFKHFELNELQLIDLDYVNRNPMAMLRGLRIALECNIVIDPSFEEHIYTFKGYELLNSQKVFEEFCKIISQKNGLCMLKKYGILEQLIPAFKQTYNFNQNNPHHDLNLFSHIEKTVENTNYSLETKLAMVFHDLGKPRTSMPNKKDNSVTSYYRHEVESSKIAQEFFKQFNTNHKIANEVIEIILAHMNKNVGLGRLNTKYGRDLGLKILHAHLSDTMGRLRVSDEEINNINKRILEFSCIKEVCIPYNSTKPEMIILIGLPRSGKSTFAKQYYSEYDYISRDYVRENTFGFKGNMNHESEVTKICNEELNLSLSKKNNIIVDNTNIQRKYRRQFIKQAQAHGYNIKAVYINTSYEQLIINAEKEGFPIGVIDSMANRLNIPSYDEGYYQIQEFNVHGFGSYHLTFNKIEHDQEISKGGSI